MFLHRHNASYPYLQKLTMTSWAHSHMKFTWYSNYGRRGKKSFHL